MSLQGKRKENEIEGREDKRKKCVKGWEWVRKGMGKMMEWDSDKVVGDGTEREGREKMIKRGKRDEDGMLRDRNGLGTERRN